MIPSLSLTNAKELRGPLPDLSLARATSSLLPDIVVQDNDGIAHSRWIGPDVVPALPNRSRRHCSVYDLEAFSTLDHGFRGSTLGLTAVQRSTMRLNFLITSRGF